MPQKLALVLSSLTAMILAGCQADTPTSPAAGEPSTARDEKSEAIVVSPEAAQLVMQRLQGEALVRDRLRPKDEPIPSLAREVSTDEKALRVRLHQLGEFRGVQRPELSPNVATVRGGVK